MQVQGEEHTNIPLDDTPAVPNYSSDPNAGDKPLSFKEKIKKKIASRNWTRILSIMTCLSGTGLVTAGVLGMINISPSTIIVSAYMVFLGALLCLVLIPWPAAWKRLNMKWFPFLHTFRGRGLFLIFLGTLATGLGITSIFIGVAVIIVGVAHVLLACYFRNTLDPSSDFNKYSQNVDQLHAEQPGQEGSATATLTDVIAEAAWNNRDKIVKAAMDNKEVMADAAKTAATVAVKQATRV